MRLDWSTILERSAIACILWHNIVLCMQVTDLKYIKVRPILLRKGDVKVALYGLSNVKDERLHRLFRENKVE